MGRAIGELRNLLTLETQISARPTLVGAIPSDIGESPFYPARRVLWRIDPRKFEVADRRDEMEEQMGFSKTGPAISARGLKCVVMTVPLGISAKDIYRRPNVFNR